MGGLDEEILKEELERAGALKAESEEEGDEEYWKSKAAKDTAKGIREVEDLILKAKITVSGGNTADGMALFEKAKRTANAIDGYGYREDIFELIAKAQLSSGMADEAIETAKMIENGSLRASILNEIRASRPSRASL